MESFEPKLSVLPPAQREVWPDLATVPGHFVLYGGTALALRLGHRASVDFDFFSSDPLDHRVLSGLPLLRGAEVLQEESSALTVSVRRGGPVKLSFFGSIDFGRVGTPQRTADGTLLAASLLDLAATKAKVLLQRVEAKDYLDLTALLRAGVGLASILGAARTLFGPAFNPLIAQKTLGWFQGGDLAVLVEEDRALLVRESTQDLDLPDIPRISDRLAA